MIPQIAKALSSGFKPKDIVDYLLKKFPQHTQQIKDAMAAGFTVDQIVKFLGGGKKALNEHKEEPSEATTEHEETQRGYLKDEEARKKKTLQAGALAASAIGGSLAAPAIGSAIGKAAPGLSAALQRAAPQLMGQGAIPGALSGVQGALGGTQTQAPQAPQAPAPSATPQAPMIGQQGQPPAAMPQTPAPAAPTMNPVDILSKAQSKEKVDELLKSGNDPASVAGFFQKFHPKIIKEVEKESGKPFEEVIADYAASQPKEEQITPGIQPEIEKTEEKEPNPVEKESIVNTPQGAGEVKEIRNGTALVEVDGKLHKVPVEDLEPSSFSDDEVADAYDNLMAKIPEEHRSGFIQWAGYDEDKNEIGFIPRSGKYEVLKNITPEEAQRIKEGTGVARTSGEKREGIWVQGEDTRGGIISQIIWDRKKEDKAHEEKQLKFNIEMPKREKEDKGMKPIFDELAYAREKSRAREKKIKELEREKKKKEKDEAKKRKKQA